MGENVLPIRRIATYGGPKRSPRSAVLEEYALRSSVRMRTVQQWALLTQ